MSANPQSPWSPPFASVAFTSDTPVTIPTSPQGILQVVEVTPKQQWDVVLSPNANAPKVEQAHWDVGQLQTTPPTTSVQNALNIQPSPVNYPGSGGAVRITSNNMATGVQADFIGTVTLRGTRVGPIGG